MRGGTLRGAMDRPPQQWLPPVPAYDPGPPPAPQPQPQPQREGLRRLFGPLLVAGAFLLKFGKGLFVVVKGAKFLTTSASMLVSVAAYALIWGWKFGVGFVALLFVHEMGHAVQMRREGIKVGGMAFIPFMGAVVWSKQLEGNAAAEARVGLAGPVIGSLAAALCLVPYAMTGDDFWRALAFVGFFLNLFNLLPVTPLDGGRAFSALTPWMWFVGLFLVVVLVFTFPSPILILIALFAAFDVYRRWKARNAPGGRDYYRVTKRQRAGIALVYVTLLVSLAVGMDATFLERDFDDV